MAELEERKKFRHHPLTGIFHSLPGYYDPLHKLASCRRVMTAEGIYSDTESLRSFVAMDITDSDDFASLQQPSHMNRMYSDSRCIPDTDLMTRPRRFSDGDADPFFNGNKTNSPNSKHDNGVEYSTFDDSDVGEGEFGALEQKETPRSLPLNVLSITDKYDVPPPVGGLPPRRLPYKKPMNSAGLASTNTESGGVSSIRSLFAPSYGRAELSKSAGYAEMTDGFISTGKGIFRKVGLRSSQSERMNVQVKSKQGREPAELKLQRIVSEDNDDDDVNDEYTQAAPRIPANPFVARRLNDGDELRIMAIHRTGIRDSTAQVLKNDDHGSDSEDEYNQPKPYFIHEKAVTEQYELVGEDQLGDGSYAVVKPAIRRVNGKEVAIKQIHKRFLRDEAAKNAVSREIEIHLRLRHKHIVRLYEVYETPDFLYLVMAKATKGNLKSLMERKRMLPEALAGKLSQQIARAVVFLHDMGVLHCDLKPDNILLSDAKTANQDNGENSPVMRRPSPIKSIKDPHADVKVNDYSVELCDFGLSVKVPDVRFFKLTGDVHKVPFTKVTGTSGYIAPELLQQQPYGKPVDMWSVGIIIFEMLTGYQPFYPPHMCIEEDADFSDRVWKTISADAKDLVQRLLERDPAKRLTAAEALAHTWFESAMFAI
uniref:Putative serine/threonine protein kinase n=2 Tax=Hyaloperonospora TaxID=184462 RepID=M4BH99_HYAAE